MDETKSIPDEWIDRELERLRQNAELTAPLRAAAERKRLERFLANKGELLVEDIPPVGLVYHSRARNVPPFDPVQAAALIEAGEFAVRGETYWIKPVDTSTGVAAYKATTLRVI